MRPSKTSGDPTRDSLSVELGQWFKAHATGRGVLAIPLIVAILAILEAARLLRG
ncbi:hypothetical protein [Phenylobacterium sp.]|uniref:hypothetical protein n=1 Tax=Phenylobacterium sp. TaxID=1871053 RepID=UPI0025CECDD0|nr:hypothetical protein [Phenylobacterium sp.]